MAAAWEYEQAINNVSNWYNTSADNVWNVVNGYNLTPEQTQALLPTVDSFLYGQGANSGYNAVKAADGSILSWNNVASLQGNSANAIEQAVNSNAGTVSQQIYQLPATADYSGTGGTFNASKGVSGGIQGATNVMSQVSAAVAATGLGITLAKKFDSALYNAFPDFFDNHGMSSLNPETWNSITADMSDSGWEGTVKRAFNAIFGLDPNTGKSQMYIDADAAGYLAMYMASKGVFDPPEETGSNVHYGTASASNYFYYDYYPQPMPLYLGPVIFESGNTRYTYTTLNAKYIMVLKGSNYYRGVAISDRPFTLTIETTNTQTGDTTTTTYSASSATRTKDGSGTYYYYNLPNLSMRVNTYACSYSIPVDAGLTSFNASQAANDLYMFTFGGTISGGGGVEGITDQSGARQPDFSNCQTPDDYKNAIQTQYPSIFQNAITQNVAQPDGTVIQRTYIPVGTPSATGTQDTQPTTNPDNSGQSQSHTEVDPTSATQTIIETVVKYIENLRTPDTPDTPNPPDTGDGNTPPVVPPTGQASSLFAVYNPTQAQLNSFGAWLWSANFVDQLLKLFNDPMQSIIGLHKIFAAPQISGQNTIHVGYLDSGVSSNTVGAQYTDINCGSVNVKEQFGNAFDYTDTRVRAYLPFIGIVDLDTSDVMRGTVSIVYHVDVITGACLTEVKVTRDGGGGTLYQYAGDAAVRYPISSGSYMGVVSGVLSAVGGIASAVMTGGATLPMAAGAIAGGVSQAKTQVQHSGNFSGSAGAMGIKKPYLIIERPQSMIADNYKKYQGNGANKIITVGGASGYFKLSDVRLNSVNNASESELEQIRAALENGVIK